MRYSFYTPPTFESIALPSCLLSWLEAGLRRRLRTRTPTEKGAECYFFATSTDSQDKLVQMDNLCEYRDSPRQFHVGTDFCRTACIYS